MAAEPPGASRAVLTMNGSFLLGRASVDSSLDGLLRWAGGMGFDELFGSCRVLLFSGHVLFAGMAPWGCDARVKEAHDRSTIRRQVLYDLGVIGHSK